MSIDHEFTQEIVCPWCGYEYGDSWDCGEGGKRQCDECGKHFSFSIDYDVTYCTTRETKRDLNRVRYVKEVQERLKICPICKGKKEWYCKTASCMYPCQDCNETGYVKIKELIK